MIKFLRMCKKKKVNGALYSTLFDRFYFKVTIGALLLLGPCFLKFVARHRFRWSNNGEDAQLGAFVGSGGSGVGRAGVAHRLNPCVGARRWLLRRDADAPAGVSGWFVSGASRAARPYRRQSIQQQESWTDLRAGVRSFRNFAPFSS